jgi:hypothetical protein
MRATAAKIRKMQTVARVLEDTIASARAELGLPKDGPLARVARGEAWAVRCQF